MHLKVTFFINSSRLPYCLEVEYRVEEFANPRYSGPSLTMFTTEGRTQVLASATRKDPRNRISLNQAT